MENIIEKQQNKTLEERIRERLEEFDRRLSHPIGVVLTFGTYFVIFWLIIALIFNNPVVGLLAGIPAIILALKQNANK